MTTPVIELSDDSDIEVISSTGQDDEPLVVIQSDDNDEIEIIGEREVPDGDQFLTRHPNIQMNQTPSIGIDHFHLHLPTGRVLMSQTNVRNRNNHNDEPIRVQQRIPVHNESYTRYILRRQDRLRRQLADSLSRRTFHNALFTDITDSDDEENDEDYSPTQSVEIVNDDDDDGDNEDVEIINSIDTPINPHEYNNNTPATISPLFRIRQMMGLNQRPGNEGVPPSVMRMIQLEEERLEAKRYKKRKMEMRKVRLEMENNHKIPTNQRHFYTNDFSDGKIGCELCGVQLFIGINENGPNAKKLFDNGFKCPWNKNGTTLTDFDKDLSKMAYMAKCGHMYCGRCVHRIKTYMDLNGVEKRKLIQKDKNETKLAIESNGGSIPMEIEWKLTKNCSPSSCVGLNCSNSFGKNSKSFYQLFT